MRFSDDFTEENILRKENIGEYYIFLCVEKVKNQELIVMRMCDSNLDIPLTYYVYEKNVLPIIESGFDFVYKYFSDNPQNLDSLKTYWDSFMKSGKKFIDENKNIAIVNDTDTTMLEKFFLLELNRIMYGKFSLSNIDYYKEMISGHIRAIESNSIHPLVIMNPLATKVETTFMAKVFMDLRYIPENIVLIGDYYSFLKTMMTKYMKICHIDETFYTWDELDHYIANEKVKSFNYFLSTFPIEEEKMRDYLTKMSVEDFETLHSFWYGIDYTRMPARTLINKIKKEIEYRKIIKNDKNDSRVKALNKLNRKWEYFYRNSDFNDVLLPYENKIFNTRWLADHEKIRVFEYAFDSAKSDQEKYDMFSIFFLDHYVIENHFYLNDVICRFIENNVSYDEIVRIFKEIEDTEKHLTFEQWNKYIDNYDEYKSYPIDWLFNLL